MTSWSSSRSHRNRVRALVWSDAGSCSLKVLAPRASNKQRFDQFIYRQRNQITSLPTLLFLIHRKAANEYQVLDIFLLLDNGILLYKFLIIQNVFILHCYILSFIDLEIERATIRPVYLSSKEQNYKLTNSYSYFLFIVKLPISNKFQKFSFFWLLVYFCINFYKFLIICLL